MLWLLSFALGVFVWRQHVALKRLEAKLDESILFAEALRRLVTDPGRRTAPASDAEPAATAVAAYAPPSDRTVASATPSVPEAPSAPLPPAPSRIQPGALSAAPSEPRPVASAPSVRPQSSTSPVTWTSVSTWLAENGLAWIGGGGLALGGLLLVAYAAQKGVFTPPLRVTGAVVLSGLMIAASEWILRQKPAPGGRHLLAAAVAAGAGAVTLYGAVCAAYALYGMLPFTVAAVLGATVSLALLGLSLRHGEPLALLAIAGAVITPGVTGMDDWSPFTLHAYALLIGVTGFVISTVRRWDRAGFATVIGLLLWSLAPQFSGGGALLVLAAIGPMCGVLWRRRQDREDAKEPKPVGFARQPYVALILTTLASANLWLGDLSVPAYLPQAALIAGILIAAGAAMVRLGLARPQAFAAPVAMAVAMSVLTLVIHARHPGLAIQLPWIHALTALIPLAALVTGLRSPPAPRTILLGIGGVGVATFASLSWLVLDQVGATLAWTPPAVLATALFAGSVLIARRVEQPTRDVGLGLWLAAAAELAFLSIHAAVPAYLEPVAFSVAALTLAIGAGCLSWRGLAQTSVVGGLAALITMLRPDVVSATLEGRLPLPFALGVSVGASVLLFLAARLTSSVRTPNRNEAEAQGVAALAILLIGLFIALQVALAGIEDQAGSGELFEGTLRTLILLSAGLILIMRQRSDDGPIARWRTVVIVGAGVVHGLFVQGLVWNPWWGAGAPPAGLPVFNTLVLPFLAPAILLAATAWRCSPLDGWARAWLSAAAAFAFLWVLMVLRHLFQGSEMGGFDIGRAEACAYAVLLLLTARVFTEERLGLIVGRTGWLRRFASPAGSTAPPLAEGRPGTSLGRTAWLHNAAVPIGWMALVFSGLVFGVYASPWWGPQQAPIASTAAALLLFALYAAGAVGFAGLGQTSGAFGKTAAVGVVGVLFALMSLIIRWCFHGEAMSEPAPGGALETWTFSALWAGFGLATLSLGTARKAATLRWSGLTVLAITAVKVMMFDLARLEGVIRAASFLAVGALFLGGALVVRRLNGQSAMKTSDLNQRDDATH